MSIELKNGEIVEGELTNVDNWMNLTLSNVVQYDSAGSSGVKTSEVYLRGTYIKYIKLNDSLIDQVKQQINSNSNNQNRRSNKYSGNNNAGPGQSGNYRRNNQNRRPYNQSGGGANRRYNQNPRHQHSQQQQAPSNNGMGGYVQQHQSQNGNVEF